MISVLKMNLGFKGRSLFSILATLQANSKKEADISSLENQLSNMGKSCSLILMLFQVRIHEPCRKIIILEGFSQFIPRWTESNLDGLLRKSENFAVRFQTIFLSTYLRNFWKNFSSLTCKKPSSISTILKMKNSKIRLFIGSFLIVCSGFSFFLWWIGSIINPTTKLQPKPNSEKS